MATKTQNERIWKYLKDGGLITPIKALNLYGCFRLAARIYDIERSGRLPPGRVISRRRVKTSTGKYVIGYYLESPV